MIEIIRTFNPTTRSDGNTNLGEHRAFRCTKCELITLLRKDIVKHTCKPKQQ